MSWAAPIIGSVAGALISRKPSSTTSTQTAEPWSGVQKPLLELYGSALENFRGGGPQYYPGQTVAGQSGYTQQAQQLAAGRALQGNPLLGQAQGVTEDILGGGYFSNPSTQGLTETGSGAYLNANPYLDQTFDRASDAVSRQFRNNVMPGIASMFAQGGRYGSNAMSEGLGQAEQAYGDTLNNLATDIYGGNYARERVLQQQALGELGNQFGKERLLQNQALGLAPQLAQADYFDIGQLANVGASQDTYQQSLLDSDVNRWNFNQNRQNDALAFLNSILAGATDYRSNIGTQTERGNPIQGALGGWQLGQSLFGGGGTNSMGNSIYNPITQTGGWSGTSLAPFFYGNAGSGG